MTANGAPRRVFEMSVWLGMKPTRARLAPACLVMTFPLTAQSCSEAQYYLIEYEPYSAVWPQGGWVLQCACCVCCVCVCVSE
jgi:hypothetical protein